MLTLRGAVHREDTMRQALCVGVDGISLHAAVRVGAHVRTRLDQQCRFIISPAPPDERIQIDAP